MSSNRPSPLTSFALALLFAVVGSQVSRGADAAHAKWEPEIQAFEASDRTNPPPQGAILFVGSSSIRMWKTLAEDFKGIPVINRGFGGSQMEDSVYFAARIVLLYRPKQIFVYAGDNDLANGKTPEQILTDFKALVSRVEQRLPETRIAYIAIKPSPSRWKLAGKMREANRLIAAFTRTDRRLVFVDVFTPMLDDKGEPREDLFVGDKLHLNKKGYDLWTSLIRPMLAP